jgi:hypothetical protein
MLVGEPLYRRHGVVRGLTVDDEKLESVGRVVLGRQPAQDPPDALLLVAHGNDHADIR